jgi:molybdopterin-guanine dinucleotide biosynthesis protein A
VGRHAFLSEHLCRVFSDAGADCEPVVGAAEALRRASELEPHAVVCDCDLITPALLDSWAAEAALAQVPVLAVSLTRRPEESMPADLCGLAAVIYLPSIEREHIVTLLAGLPRARGVTAPPAWRMSAPAASVHTG